VVGVEVLSKLVLVIINVTEVSTMFSHKQAAIATKNEKPKGS